MQHCLGLGQRLLKTERPANGSHRWSGITECFRGSSMSLLVGPTRRQGVRRALGLEQRLRFGEEPPRCHASRAVASVATSASPTARAARLPRWRSRVHSSRNHLAASSRSPAEQAIKPR